MRTENCSYAKSGGKETNYCVSTQQYVEISHKNNHILPFPQVEGTHTVGT